MKIVMINSVCGIRSTGKICTDFAMFLQEQGHDVKIVYGREDVPKQYEHFSIRTGNIMDVRMHALLARTYDGMGLGSKHATEKLIKWIEEYDPDVIHLHNIHGYYINILVLFEYLRRCNKKIIWSLHDCWSFTGHCAHFDFYGCEKWLEGCHKCNYINDYPKTLFEHSERNYKIKQKLFCGIPNMTIVVPSIWLKEKVEKSFLNCYPIEIIKNGIDLKSFTPNYSYDFRSKYSLEDKIIVLGVASFWIETKGLEYLINLSKDLPEEKYKVVIVGNVSSKVTLPKTILNIPETTNIEELCAIYSSANVFVNPTLQETQGLTTVEALACGTPAIVFNSGGAPECIDASCGIVVEKTNYDQLLNAVLSFDLKGFEREVCITKSKEYSKEICISNYYNLYLH